MKLLSPSSLLAFSSPIQKSLHHHHHHGSFSRYASSSSSPLILFFKKNFISEGFVSHSEPFIYKTTKRNNSMSSNNSNNKLLPEKGVINIYNEQSTIPNINMNKIEQTIFTIRDVIGYNSYSVNLVLVEDEYMKETNLDSRGIDKPTDILSFPLHDTVLGGAKGAGTLVDPEFNIPEYYCLGDMMIDVPYVMRRIEEDKLYNESESGHEDDEYDDEEYDDDDDEEDYVGDDDRGVSGAMATIYDPEERIQLLLVHGMLHLVGYDHIEDDDYEVMVTKEEEIVKLLQEAKLIGRKENE